uniref:NADH-ubiquinone oxidoreductase chain 2 n=1 Tax=Ixodes uriae TaxID=59655 RepID=Q6F6D4_IXOUR|nr:NADH dehydrogenase subunit 2 [Ixodes uriae]BAD27241.1 NADH dehydrogenase subunit 2 [Ixodes uriae]
MMNFIFLWMLGLSILMSMSSSSWFSFWLSMEINMMMFIPLMNSKNFLSCNSMINYFIIQSLASSMFLFSSILFFSLKITLFYNIIILSILIKLAAAPFHMWFPQISENISYKSFFLLSTIQKIIPLQILSVFNNNKIILFIVLSATLGTLGGFNQISLRKILAFSSISHLAWMMTLIMINQFYWIIYFMMYFFILLKIIIFLKMNFINTINNFYTKNLLPMNKFQLFSTFMSLGGLPPFMGFFMKLLSIILIINKMPFILVILILSSLGNLYFYSRILFPLVLSYNAMVKNYNVFSINSTTFFLINMTMFIMLLPWVKLL